MLASNKMTPTAGLLNLSIRRHRHVSAQLTAKRWQKGQDPLSKLRLETGGKIKAALLI